MGNGYINNTQGEGFNYFAAVGYAPEGSNHSLNFTFLGAGQWHHQRDVFVSIRDYQNFSGDKGYLLGTTITDEREDDKIVQYVSYLRRTVF